MKKPAKCITPKRDRDAYKLTATDLRKLNALVKEANDMLSYYINMPENHTGDLESPHCESYESLCENTEDLLHTLINIIMV